MAARTILILGGGVGGIVTANALSSLLDSEHHIVLVEKESQYTFTPSLLWVMVGWRKPDQITRELHHLVHKQVDVRHAEVQELDLDQSKVKTSTGSIDYDYLVVALGAGLAPGLTPGFSEAALSSYDLNGVTGVYSALQDFEGGRVAVLVSGLPYKCPAAPYETALLLDDYFRRNGIRERSKTAIYTPEILPMGSAGEPMGQAVVGMLQERAIPYNPELNLTHIEPSTKELHFSNHEPVPFDLLVGVPPHRPPQVVKDSPISNEAGWVPVNKRTLQTNVDNVFAIGDVATITLADGKPLPKAGVFAEGQARAVAQSIADDIQGNETRTEFDGLGFCWIETGAGSAGFASGHFYTEPEPQVPLPQSGKLWHLGKILFERYWLSQGISRELYRLGLNIGSKILGVSAPL